MNPRHALLGSLVIATAAGCGVDLGGGAFRQVNDAHWVGTGHIAASTKIWPGTPFNQRGFLVGTELQGRGEQDVGARWTGGLRVGYGSSSDPVPGSFGWEVHGDFGTPLGAGGLFPRWSSYAGGTAAGTFWLSSRHEAADLNGASWFLKRAIELVPYVRVRAHFDHFDDSPMKTRTDVGGGLVLRLRVMSDFL
jgi:hypothetical protein